MGVRMSPPDNVQHSFKFGICKFMNMGTVSEDFILIVFQFSNILIPLKFPRPGLPSLFTLQGIRKLYRVAILLIFINKAGGADTRFPRFD